MGIEQKIYNHKDQLYRLCLYLEKNIDRAEDLFQDTWVKALEKIHTYDTSRDFYPWLTQIAVNTYRDKLRRLKLELKRRCYVPEGVMEETYSNGENLESTFFHKEELRAVMEGIQQLPDKYKLPLLLIMEEKLSYKEVSDILEISEKLVKSRIYEGRQKLKQLLEKEALEWMTEN